MRIADAVNLEDVRRMAKRRLPRIAYDFIEGGVEDERCLERNRESFARHTLMPRYMVDVDRRDQSVSLFGRSYSSPFGISPAGVAGLFRPGTDRMLAEEAARANIPFVVPAAGQLLIEDAAKVAGECAWFQVYGTRDPAIVDDMVRRARDSGIANLVFTADVPIVPRRERNIRNRFSRPLRLTPRRVIEGLTHPAWLIDFLRAGGVPLLVNWAAYAKDATDKDEVGDLFGVHTPASGQDWATLDRIRRLWPGKLIVKGILHPGDALRCVEAGADGIVVSNHGGRQLDSAPSPVDMLLPIRAAVGPGVTLMLDSGVRRGADILVARCLGADFAFFARPTLYGSAAAGNAGIAKVISILRTEIDLTLAQIGCPDIKALDAGFLTETVLSGQDRPAAVPGRLHTLQRG